MESQGEESRLESGKTKVLPSRCVRTLPPVRRRDGWLKYDCYAEFAIWCFVLLRHTFTQNKCVVS